MTASLECEAGGRGGGDFVPASEIGVEIEFFHDDGALDAVAGHGQTGEGGVEEDCEKDNWNEEHCY